MLDDHQVEEQKWTRVDLTAQEEEYSEEAFGTNTTDCAMCMEDFATKGKSSGKVVRLPCEPKKHFFHSQCISKWLK